MEKAIIQELEDLKNQQMEYNGMVVTILGYAITGDSGNDVEIYTNRLTIESNLFQINKTLKKFRPIHEQARLLAKEQQKKMTVLDSDSLNEIRDTVLTQIRMLRENPSEENIKMCKAVNESITTLTNLARTELEYRRHFNKLNEPRK